MAMKKSGVLKVIYDTSFPVNKLVIHPNTGFELNFMQIKYNAKAFINTNVESFVSGDAEAFCDVEIFLLNECKQETIEIGLKMWQQLDEPDKILLVYDEEQNRIMLAGGKN